MKHKDSIVITMEGPVLDNKLDRNEYLKKIDTFDFYLTDTTLYKRILVRSSIAPDQWSQDLIYHMKRPESNKLGVSVNGSKIKWLNIKNYTFMDILSPSRIPKEREEQVVEEKDFTNRDTTFIRLYSRPYGFRQSNLDYNMGIMYYKTLK